MRRDMTEEEKKIDAIETPVDLDEICWVDVRNRQDHLNQDAAK